MSGCEGLYRDEVDGAPVSRGEAGGVAGEKRVEKMSSFSFECAWD